MAELLLSINVVEAEDEDPPFSCVILMLVGLRNLDVFNAKKPNPKVVEEKEG